MTTVSTIKPKVTHRFCPDCGFTYLQEELQGLDADAKCPDCKLVPVRQFTPIDWTMFDTKIDER